MQGIQTGVIGFGLAGRIFHAPFVSAVPGLRLCAIVQRTGDDCVRAYPQTQHLRSADELLGRADIELVVVATPNPTHFELGMQALHAGKHVVIDKPFAGTEAQAREMTALARSKGLVLAPFHNRRWDGDFLTVSKLLDAGTLGRVVSFESHFDRYRPLQRENTWKEAGDPSNGLLYDLGPHLVDQTLALFGSPNTVTASVRSDRDRSEIEDAFDIALGYAGCIAWCRSSMLAAEAAPRFLIHGVNGSFRKYGLDPQEPALVGGAKVPPMGSAEVWLEEPASEFGTLALAHDLADPGKLLRSVVPTERGDYREFYANVRDTILGATLTVTPEAGANAIRVLELARQSSHERRTVYF